MPRAEDQPETRLVGLLRLGTRRPKLNRATRLELLLFLVVLGLSAGTAPETPDGRANGPLMASLESYTGSGVCVYRRVTGIPCGGCGMTRGFVQLAHARPLAAARLNPLAPLLFAWVFWRTVQLLVLNLSWRWLRLAVPKRFARAGYALAALAVIGLFLVRLISGLVR